MGQIIRQISPNTTRYYWYPGDKKEWLRALIAFAAGGAVLGVTYLLTRSMLTATVLGLSTTTGIGGFNFGRRELRALDGLAGQVGRRAAAAASGRAAWRGLVEGVAAGTAALIIANLGARGFLADWVLPLVPAVVGALTHRAGALSVRLTKESAPASTLLNTERLSVDPLRVADPQRSADPQRNADPDKTERLHADPQRTERFNTERQAGAWKRREHSTDADLEPGAAV